MMIHLDKLTLYRLPTPVPAIDISLSFLQDDQSNMHLACAVTGAEH